MRVSFPLRVLLTALGAWGAAQLCLWWKIPLPWMLGPLIATSLASMAGAPTASWGRARNAAQWTIGAALGLYFTPAVTALVASMWWVILLGIVWALWLGWLFGAWLYHVHGPRMPDVAPQQLRATCYFAGAIGAASEMTLLSERENSRTELVASSHSLRLVIVTVVIPFALQWSGLHGSGEWGAVRAVHLPGLALLALCTGLGAWLMLSLDRANPWFLGALLASMGLAMLGLDLSAVPQWMMNGAQLLIGVSLGVRFRRDFLRTAPRWLATVALGSLVLMALCALFAAAVAWATGMPWVTLVLGTAPGGIAEMAITAKVLQLGVPVVTALQVCRLMAVLLVVEPLYRRLYKSAGQAA